MQDAAMSVWLRGLLRPIYQDGWLRRGDHWLIPDHSFREVFLQNNHSFDWLFYLCPPQYFKTHTLPQAPSIFPYYPKNYPWQMASRWLVVPSSHVWVQLYSWFVGNSLRISVAILHVLTTMVPDYTQTFNRFHFEHHHEKPFRGDGEGMIWPTRLAILYFDFHARSVVCNWDEKSARGHFELSKHTSRAPSAWSFKTTHRGKAIVPAGQWSFAL